METISVVVPVYNTGNRLRSAVESVQAQGYDAFELILIDDGSDQVTAALCDELALQDSRIRVAHTANQGSAAARNRGIDMAKGPYLCFLDSDDYLDPGALPYMVQLIENQQADLVLCGYYLDLEQDGVVRLSQQVLTPNRMLFSQQDLLETLPQLKSKNLLDPMWNKLYRLDIVRQSGVRLPQLDLFEDGIFNLQLLPHLKKVVLSSRCFVHYLQREGQSLTKRYHPQKLSSLDQLVETMEAYILSVDGPQAEAMHYCFYYYLKTQLSGFTDLFFPSANLTAKQRKQMIRRQVETERYRRAAVEAQTTGLFNRVVLWVAKSRRVWLIHPFCRLIYLLKYRMRRLFFKLK